MAARSPRGAAAAAAAFLSPTPRTLGGPGTPVLAECPRNDDERERRQRRRSRVVESSLQGLGSPSLRYGRCAGLGLRGEPEHRPRLDGDEGGVRDIDPAGMGMRGDRGHRPRCVPG